MSLSQHLAHLLSRRLVVQLFWSKANYLSLDNTIIFLSHYLGPHVHVLQIVSWMGINNILLSTSACFSHTFHKNDVRCI